MTGRKNGFTLAELLIALAILGVIATFTIPKVLQSQQDGKWKSIAKEAAGMVSESYVRFKQTSQQTASTTMGDITPYFNYVKVYTGLIDEIPTGDSASCTAGNGCVQLHNGAVVLWTSNSFNGTTTLNAVRFYVDPDGKYSGSPGGEGKSVWMWLYTNGRMTSREHCLSGTDDSVAGTFVPIAGTDPPWFSWD